MSSVSPIGQVHVNDSPPSVRAMTTSYGRVPVTTPDTCPSVTVTSLT
jgi:hypothetical protein